MALLDVSLPKKYKDGEVLFEETLDAWRQATEAAFAMLNLNMTQLAKDLFPSNYEFNNDGNQTLFQYLQQQITNIITGATPITGTSSDTWTINTDGNSSTLTTASLTAIRTHTLADISGTFAMLEGTQTFSGTKTFVNADINGGTWQGIIDGASSVANGVVFGFAMAGGTAPFTCVSGTVVANLNADMLDGFHSGSFLTSLPNHGHTAGAGDGGLLTWGSVWANAVHTHGDAGNGGTLGWATIFSVATAGDHAHTGNTTGGILGAQTPVNHAHTAGAGDGGLLDWDTCWADPAHTHGSAAEGGSTIYGESANPPDTDSRITAQSLAKAWGYFTTDGAGAVTASTTYNITSIAKSGISDHWVVTFNNAMTSTIYVVVASCREGLPLAGDDVMGDRAIQIGELHTTYFTCTGFDSDGTRTTDNMTVHFVCYGAI